MNEVDGRDGQHTSSEGFQRSRTIAFESWYGGPRSIKTQQRRIPLAPQILHIVEALAIILLPTRSDDHLFEIKL